MEKRRKEEAPGVFPAVPAGEAARGRGIEPGTPAQEPIERVIAPGRSSEPSVDQHRSR